MSPESFGSYPEYDDSHLESEYEYDEYKEGETVRKLTEQTIHEKHSRNRESILFDFSGNRELMLSLSKINSLLTHGLYRLCKEGPIEMDIENQMFIKNIRYDIEGELDKYNYESLYDFYDILDTLIDSAFTYKTFVRISGTFDKMLKDLKQELLAESYTDGEDEVQLENPVDVKASDVMEMIAPKREILKALKEHIKLNPGFKYKKYIENLNLDRPFNKNKLYGIFSYYSSQEVFNQYTEYTKGNASSLFVEIEKILDQDVVTDKDLQRLVKLSGDINSYASRDENILKKALSESSDNSEKIIYEQLMASRKLEKYGVVDLDSLNVNSENKFGLSNYLRIRELRYNFKNKEQKQPILHALLKNLNEDVSNIELIPEQDAIQHLITFQKKHNLKPDGLFGPKTYKKILEVTKVEASYVKDNKVKRVYHN